MTLDIHYSYLLISKYHQKAVITKKEKVNIKKHIENNLYKWHTMTHTREHTYFIETGTSVIYPELSHQ